MTSKIFLAVAAVLSLLIALVSYRFLFLGLELSFDVMLNHITDRRVFFVAHIAASPIALAIGAFQFMPKLRQSRKSLHRWMGRVYGVAILVGGIGGLGIGINAIGGPIASVGFSALAIVWMTTTAIAIYYAMQRKLGLHRRWMFRSFAVTLAGVTLRLQLPILMASGMSYENASVWLAYSCWIPNLLIAEWLLSRPKKTVATV